MLPSGRLDKYPISGLVYFKRFFFANLLNVQQIYNKYILYGYKWLNYLFIKKKGKSRLIRYLTRKMDTSNYPIERQHLLDNIKILVIHFLLKLIIFLLSRELYTRNSCA